jgi:hypothetical protein
MSDTCGGRLSGEKAQRQGEEPSSLIAVAEREENYTPA